MKTLLVPTDFSSNAASALDYAAAIANHFGSTILLVNTYKAPRRADMFVPIDEFIRQDAQQQMDEQIKRVGPELKNGATVETFLLQGEIVPTLLRFAEQKEVDLIVMGTQGASGLKEVFIGSTTSALMTQTRRPVLAIPNGYAFRPVASAVLAIDDFDISSHTVVAPLTRIARSFNAKVLVYHVERASDDAGIDPSVDIFLDGVEHSFHYELNSREINDSINDFVLDSRADLLCMIQRDRGFFEKLLRGSTTRKEVFDSPVPLLVLHDVK